MHRIVVSAVVIRDEQGRILTVRKRGTRLFMLVGGKPEPGEGPDAAAIREACEEVGLALERDRLQPLGVFTTAAANEPDHELVSTCFEHPYDGGAVASAEIAELRWLDLREPLPGDLAPLLIDALIPVFRTRSAH